VRIMVDAACQECGALVDDVLMTKGQLPNCECGGALERRWHFTRTAHVHGDDIPGGVWIEHGLCNADGSPRKYYSKSEMAREAKARGLVNLVEHKPDNKGTDKSANTQRFI
jgi:hypothetical protein